jgi:hypothetical protein
MNGDNAASLKVSSVALVQDGVAALSSGVVANPDRGGRCIANVADDERPTGLTEGHPGEGGARGDHAPAAGLGPAMWTGSLCGADGTAADTIRYRKHCP